MDAAVSDEKGGSILLVLSRKNQEPVVVGANDDLGGAVRVTVLEIGQGNVRLGFEANRDVSVHREEVWERIHTSRPRDPPTGGSDRTESRDGDAKAIVLSGEGQGRSPDSAQNSV